jgi:hypothetical protein
MPTELSNATVDGISRKAFEQAIKRTGLTFPEGKMTHILRNTSTSYLMNGCNIQVLKKSSTILTLKK